MIGIFLLQKIFVEEGFIFGSQTESLGKRSPLVTLIKTMQREVCKRNDHVCIYTHTQKKGLPK